MASRADFLRQLWDELINAPMQEHWIDNSIAAFEKRPMDPFADTGAVLKRLLSLGAMRRELSLLSRSSSYEAVFQTLYMLGDPGVDGDEIEMLHEELLVSDPSGKEGRPGSAPEKA